MRATFGSGNRVVAGCMVNEGHLRKGCVLVVKRGSKVGQIVSCFPRLISAAPVQHTFFPDEALRHLAPRQLPDSANRLRLQQNVLCCQS